MYISCHFFTTWTIYLILYSSKFLSNLIICDVKMSNKKDDSILLVSFTSVFEKICFWKIIWCTIHFGKTRSRINNKFLNKAVPKQYVMSKEHFLSKSVQKKKSGKKNYVVFFSVFVLGEKVCIIRQNSKSSHLQIHVSLQQPIMFTVTRTWNMAAKLGKGGGLWSDEQPLCGN